jgi:hypothetical protein
LEVLSENFHATKQIDHLRFHVFSIMVDQSRKSSNSTRRRGFVEAARREFRHGLDQPR